MGTEDKALVEVIDAIEKKFGNPSELVAAFSMRIVDAFDAVLMGPKTKRWRLSQLQKTEKTYLGTRIELEVQDLLEVERGSKSDLLIAGQEVDVKFSGRPWGWMIPREAVNELCLLIYATDEPPRFSLGIVRANEDLLGEGKNQDGKKTIRADVRNKIHWIVETAPLPQNLLHRLPPKLREEIFSNPSGQGRITALLKAAVGEKITRQVIATLATQDDPMRRIRKNLGGGARDKLLKDGVIVLTSRSHDQIFELTGAPKLKKGEVLSWNINELPKGSRDQILKLY